MKKLLVKVSSSKSLLNKNLPSLINPNCTSRILSSINNTLPSSSIVNTISINNNNKSFYHTNLTPLINDKNVLDGQHDMHGTTVLCCRKGGKVCLYADGQVTLGSVVMKNNARKLRTVGSDVIAGFAGSTADAITLFERLEGKLEEYPGQLMRACVEMAKLWRTDKYLRKLEAVMIVADKTHTLILTGNGDVLEPTEGGDKDSVIGIGSGGHYAIAAAKALLDVEGYDAEKICQKAMEIAGEICIYTNKNFTKLILEEVGGEVKITEN